MNLVVAYFMRSGETSGGRTATAARNDDLPLSPIKSTHNLYSHRVSTQNGSNFLGFLKP